ncbi:glycosyltransferase family 4 protein [Chloroflexus sp.]|uniref:glycosyltransferase family 4 protein n=1 Tax=Chloroflexus sp. TaxID=1904827 RepID=UPI00298F1F65|nr:glycosyltransferase family 4 protein [Chloroflexus sp.]MDW8405488.1 glycosyltransferase family 4 protein [Chloroflexus sp.]
MSLRLAFLTVGDPNRLTGGYLYHREVFRRWRAQGHRIDEIVLGPADVAGQLAAAPLAGERFTVERYDALLVDALARAVVAPWLEHWRAQRPLIALIHELPAVAGASDPREHDWEQALLRADALVAVSDDGAATLIARGADPARVFVASGGCDRLLARLPEGMPREPLVIAVGQWIPRKNQARLARAWGQAAAQGWRLELIGETEADPAYAAEVWQAVRACPAPVIVRGPLNDAELAHLYARASVFALPSRFEGYGLVFAEALACGLPVIAGAVGPVPALVDDGGLLVPPDDEQALAVALRAITTDPTLRARLSIAAQRRAATLPRWDDTAQRLLQAVQWACGR